jgi:hypothetical protein
VPKDRQQDVRASEKLGGSNEKDGEKNNEE